MKLLIGLSIAATVLFAQPDDFFTQWKTSMSDNFNVMLPYMQQTRACIAAAEGKSDAEKCMKIIDEMHKKIGNDDDAEGDSQADNTEPWNEKTQKQTLLELDESIRDLKIMKQCAQESHSFDGFESCQKKHGVKSMQ